MKRAHPLLLLILILCTGCHRTAFEQAQFNAEAANPHWLEIDLDTTDHRRTYKESEFFGFTVGYSSAVRELYKLEIAERSSTIVFTDRLHISDGHVQSMHVFGVVCCSSRIIGLNDEPYVVQPQRRFRLKPGTYRMYMTTRRVFPWNITSDVYHPSDWVTASNMIKIKVIPDPGWQERALAKINAKLADPSMCAALSILDIPAATAQKLEIIRNGAPCEWQSEFNETEYASALKGMDQLIQSPTHGVIQADVNLTLQMRNWLAHTESRVVPSDEEAYKRWSEAERPVFVESERGLIRELCDTLPTKTPDARMTTRRTIDSLTENQLLGIPNCLP